MDFFNTAYKELNAEQRAAVDQTEGAVLVIAGPGTGKTQLLSLRVANILKKTDSNPENIVCLTFTNKAAGNMQVRLSRLIGSAAQRVMIKTFHSFAAEIMNLYPDYFWNGASLTNVPDAVQTEIITEILSSLPLDNPLALKFAGKFTSVGDVLEGLKLTKEAGLTPDKLRALIELNIRYLDILEPELKAICEERLSYKKLEEIAMQVEALPTQPTDELTRPLISLATLVHESFETAYSADADTGKTKHVSAWKSRWIQSVEGKKGMYDERKRNAWWLALADVYEKYRTTLHEQGYYDYADMIIEVISQLENNPDMLADIQERFHYVLIDEFQDTNGAQLRLAHKIADHETANGNPNIMAVGDDDQSIYKFNGAELSNMLGFTRSYPSAQVYVLSKNYRSSQDVLDFSSQVIKQVSERINLRHISLTKDLRAENEPDTPGTIEHVSYPTKEHQYYELAKKIKQSHDKKEEGSIAVLARSHESLRALAHTLQLAGVPVRYEQQQNILELPMIAEVILLCEIITALGEGNEPMLNTLLPRLLAHDAWQIEPTTVWKLAIRNRYEPQWIESCLTSGIPQLETMMHWLLWLAQQASEIPLTRMLEYIIGLTPATHMTSPLREYFLAHTEVDTPYLAHLSAVHKLIGLAQDFCTHGHAKVSDFVRLIHVARDNSQIITDDSLFVTADNSVELLTVHKAKGLEFDSVFIVDAVESTWKPTVRGRRAPSNLPLRPSGDTYDDFVRLFFVAITRAKKNICIASYRTNESGEPVIASSIIRDILPAKELPYEGNERAVEVLESTLRWPRLEGSQEKILMADVLKDYVLSPTAFLDFLDVAKGGPDYFLQRHLLRLPEPQTNAAAYGNAIHSALECAQQYVLDDTYEVGKVLNAYETALRKQQLSNTDYERYLTHGQSILLRLLEDYQLTLPKEGRPEVKLSVFISDVPLRGKLDHVAIKDDTAVISDYKTSKPLATLFTRSKDLELKAWRHRTQLELYTLMLQTSAPLKPFSKIEAQMIYVEAETKKELIRGFEPSAESLAVLKKLIPIVHAKIQNFDLPSVLHYEQSYAGVRAFIDDLLKQ